MKNATPRAIERADYTPANYSVEAIELCFELNPSDTRVYAKMKVCRNEGVEGADLVLDGSELELLGIKMNGVELGAGEYTLDPVTKPTTLTIHNVEASAVIETETIIDPSSNTVLEGLYLSSGNYCTQCEAEGFRRITWYPDRPDVMARYRVKIVAEKTACPVLLSNGNEVDRGELADGRHWVTWEDPWPKPSYLFALVAGDLSHIKQQYTTATGRNVELCIYVQQHNINKCDHAMASLVLAMRWDEEVFGLEYDLDRYMIVAVDDFNMGAMENKGLNIFNSKYVLADQATATDRDFLGIESVVAHEYFHNWTGNRVTCRDWFQLSLKEGLTVFRDQEFSADHHSRAVKRIEDVRFLRARQFPEDAGPLAHPVRPDSYIEINNFYTLTIYEKGAEVIRMMHTIVGAANFRRGIDLYLSRHDGQAVTCEDFVCAMEEATQIDLAQFRLWYSQTGTPCLSASESYDAENAIYTLTIAQSLPSIEGQKEALPMHIPVAIALFDSNGKHIPIRTNQDKGDCLSEVFDITGDKQEIQFSGVSEKPVPSLLRGFSAPVVLEFNYSDDDLAFLLANETDPFNRWEAGQRLLTRAIESSSEESTTQLVLSRKELLIQSFRQVLDDDSADSAFRAELLTLPDIETISERHQTFDVDRLADNRKTVKQLLAESLEDEFARLVGRYSSTGFGLDTVSIGNRALVNLCLDYLSRLPNPDWLDLVRTRFEQASNMTDQFAALGILVEMDQKTSQKSLHEFYQQWRNDRLVIDKWFSIQATADVSDAVGQVSALLQHSDFDYSNPNRVRALLGAFSSGNPVAFHRSDGSGYQLLAKQIVLLDDINPQVAARLCTPLTRWERHSSQRQKEMKSALQQIAGKPELSRDVFEVVNRGLDR